MASQVLIDFSSIGEQIAAAIKSSIKKFSEQFIVNQSTKPEPAPPVQLPYNIQEQILRKASASYNPGTHVTNQYARDCESPLGFHRQGNEHHTSTAT
jgi:hypothetical protein